jgi:hypothetical protein
MFISHLGCLLLMWLCRTLMTSLCGSSCCGATLITTTMRWQRRHGFALCHMRPPFGSGVARGVSNVIGRHDVSVCWDPVSTCETVPGTGEVA